MRLRCSPFQMKRVTRFPLEIIQTNQAFGTSWEMFNCQGKFVIFCGSFHRRPDRFVGPQSGYVTEFTPFTMWRFLISIFLVWIFYNCVDFLSLLLTRVSITFKFCQKCEESSHVKQDSFHPRVLSCSIFILVMKY